MASTSLFLVLENVNICEHPSVDIFLLKGLCYTCVVSWLPFTNLLQT